MSLLPSHLLDMEAKSDDPAAMDESRTSPIPDPSPAGSPSRDMPLLRRDSSTSGRSRGAKRRPVFVSAMVSLLPRIVEMMKDRNYLVATAARNLVLDFMRDDPSVLSRDTLHLLSGDEQSLISAATTIRTLLHVRHVLPPAMAHHVLNHLTGLLKLTVRQSDMANPLQGYAYAVPAIASLVTQVSKMSMREIRRAKVDPFLIPSGSLWWPATAPPGPMFPRQIDDTHSPIEILPQSLVWVTMVRTSQNLFFLRMLKRDPQEIRVIRKNMSRLVLPSLNGTNQEPLSLAAFTPRKRGLNENLPTTADAVLTAFSLTLARSYLLLLCQIFRSMSRHLSDRQELAILVDGLNLILLTHGDDIGIVGQAMLGM